MGGTVENFLVIVQRDAASAAAAAGLGAALSSSRQPQCMSLRRSVSISAPEFAGRLAIYERQEVGLSAPPARIWPPQGDVRDRRRHVRALGSSSCRGTFQRDSDHLKGIIMPSISSIVAALSKLPEPSTKTYGLDGNKVKVVFASRRLKVMSKIDEKTDGRYFRGAARMKLEQRVNLGLLYSCLTLAFENDPETTADLFRKITGGKAKNIDANCGNWGVTKTADGYAVDTDKAISALAIQ